MCVCESVRIRERASLSVGGGKCWCEKEQSTCLRPGLNWGPSVYKTDALPLSHTGTSQFAGYPTSRLFRGTPLSLPLKPPTVAFALSPASRWRIQQLPLPHPSTFSLRLSSPLSLRRRPQSLRTLLPRLLPRIRPRQLARSLCYHLLRNHRHVSCLHRLHRLRFLRCRLCLRLPMRLAMS